MTRVRLAVVLGAVAVLAVLATAVVAAATYLRDDEPAPTARALVVRDPGSDARFEVPAEGWRVRDADERISYGEAAASGPAVLDEGYCHARPEGSFRAMAGFTDQDFGTWLRGLAGGEELLTSGREQEPVTLSDGTPATLRRVSVLGGRGPCSAPGFELAMLRAGDVRAVLVRDIDATLAADDVSRIVLTLELP